jgi:hypothetical protein
MSKRGGVTASSGAAVLDYHGDNIPSVPFDEFTVRAATAGRPTWPVGTGSSDISQKDRSELRSLRISVSVIKVS